jgi:hypothetical protein
LHDDGIVWRIVDASGFEGGNAIALRLFGEAGQQGIGFFRQRSYR